MSAIWSLDIDIIFQIFNFNEKVKFKIIETIINGHEM
jgi:hypothetical protein